VRLEAEERGKASCGIAFTLYLGIWNSACVDTDSFRRACERFIQQLSSTRESILVAQPLVSRYLAPETHFGDRSSRRELPQTPVFVAVNRAVASQRRASGGIAARSFGIDVALVQRGKTRGQSSADWRGAHLPNHSMGRTLEIWLAS